MQRHVAGNCAHAASEREICEFLSGPKPGGEVDAVIIPPGDAVGDWMAPWLKERAQVEVKHLGDKQMAKSALANVQLPRVRALRTQVDCLLDLLLHLA